MLQNSMLSIARTYDPGTGNEQRNQEIQKGLKSNTTALFKDGKVVFAYDKQKPTDYDLKTRPIGVGMQIVAEKALHETLLENRNTMVVAIVHIRMPSTPLCTESDQPVSHSLVSPEIVHDEACKSTVIKRTETLRDLAKAGHNTKLFIAYQEGGLNQRTPAQQAIYQKEMLNPENKSLHDVELRIKEIPEELVGATYLINDGSDDNWQAFLVKAVQAIDAGSSKIEWTYWFGSLTDDATAPRYQAVKSLLQENTSQLLDLP